MEEWKSPLNPFNSMRVLLFKEWLEACANENYLPPPMVDIDPSNRCNYGCPFCNAWDIIHKEENDLSRDHLVGLADFFAEWGVKSTCVSGGGEPMMNKGFNDLLLRLHNNGIEIGPISNGSLMTDEHIDVIAKTCRWIGFSIDSATPETYMKMKGITNEKLFDKVINNVSKLTKKIKETGSKCDVGYKFLLHPDNCNEIYEAAKLAREIGVRDFHLRPVGWDNITITKEKDKLDFSNLVENINNQIDKAMTLQTEDFRVYGIRHKFNADFTRKVNFSRCWAIPMLPTFGADGNVYLCFDMRGRKDLILCQHYPNPKEILKIWNTDFHKNMVRSINPQNCPRCTFGMYNEIVEKVFIKDEMCRNFL